MSESHLSEQLIRDNFYRNIFLTLFQLFYFKALDY